MSTIDPKSIEPPVRFSHSKIWEIQRNYFRSMGIEAWKEEVPYYVTSNTFIAHRYALLLIFFLQDWLAKHPNDITKTFYILELGCGTGKFSFYFLNAFNALLKTYQLSELKFCYIISDVVEANIEFCEKNDSLLPYINQGVVDFAFFDLVTDQDFLLKRKQKQFSALQSDTPLMVIANYIFDCVEMDLFEYDEGAYKEVQLALQSRYKHFNIKESKHLDDLRLEYEPVPVTPENYYPDPVLNQLLKEYQEQFKDQRFYLPIPLGAITFLQTLSTLTHDRYFMVAGDKGPSQLSGIPLVETRHIASYDGCYSFIVNFHALAEYLRHTGGDSLLSTNWQDFKVNCYLKGIARSDCPKTDHFFSTLLESMGPSEYCAMYKEYLTNAYRFSYSALVAILKASEYDPDAYAQVHEELIALQPGFLPVRLREIDDILQKVQKNIYSLNMSSDVSNLMGIYYYLLNQEDKAIPLFERSIRVFGNKSSSFHNLGLLYEKRKEKEKAIEYFKKAYEVDPKDELAKRKYQRLSGKIGSYIVKPILKIIVVLGFIAAAMYFIKF